MAQFGAIPEKASEFAAFRGFDEEARSAKCGQVPAVSIKYPARKIALVQKLIHLAYWTPDRACMDHENRPTHGDIAERTERRGRIWPPSVTRKNQALPCGQRVRTKAIELLDVSNGRTHTGSLRNGGGQ